jgi:crotonobetainyl-CoA:carnitine CoA-transferase CaiB-like acyl-CoA transferase
MTVPPPGLLSGVRVLDLTSVVLGPYCTKMLAQFGADVVKLEAPEGDIGRHLGVARHRGMASLFLNLNHGKRAIAVDLKSPGARPVLACLFRWADVVVHNMRQETADRLGVGYADVRLVNPGVVYCGATGFGSDGPYASLRAYDDVIQAASGQAAVQAAAHGTPQYVASALADKTVGLVACNAILAGLVRRRANDGAGCDIQVPMFEAMAEFVLVEHLGGLSYDPPAGPALYARTTSPQRRPFATCDGYLSAMVYTDQDWTRLLTAIGATEMLTDPRLGSISARTEHTGFAYGLLGEIFAKRTTAEWIELLRRHDIAVMPLNSVEDLLADPHLTATGMLQLREHASEGTLRVARSAITVNGQRPALSRLAPRLGENTAEVLAECGLSNDEIASLIARGTVIQHD